MAAATLQARKQTVCLFKSDGDADTGAMKPSLKFRSWGVICMPCHGRFCQLVDGGRDVGIR